jgi:hypothetical protein
MGRLAGIQIRTWRITALAKSLLLLLIPSGNGMFTFNDIVILSSIVGGMFGCALVATIVIFNSKIF